MGYVVGSCPKCGAKTQESCNAWVYGSPIRKCSRCNSEYLDKRWREVAVDGFDPRSQNKKLYLFASLGFLICTVLCIFWLKNMIETQGHYPIKLVGCIVIGAIGTVGCGLVFLRNITGYEDKQNEKYLQESRERLRDRAYVDKLISYGYDVPDEYRN